MRHGGVSFIALLASIGALVCYAIPSFDQTASNLASKSHIIEVEKQAARPSERLPLDQGSDNCPATLYRYTGFSDAGTTVGRSNNHTATCAYNASPDVVYEYVPPVSGPTTISLCGSNFDTILEIRDGPCPGTTVLACNDDSPNCGLQSEISMTMTAGVHYTIWVDGYGTSTGDYLLSINGPAPQGETTSVPIAITLPFLDMGNTCRYRDDYGNACIGVDAAGDVVYAISPIQAVTVDISLCHSGFDTKLYVSSAPSMSPLLACNDDAPDCPCASEPLRSYISNLTLSPSYAGQTFYIVVDGYGSYCGDYFLTVTESPGCDVMAQAGDLIETTEDCTETGYWWANDPNGCTSEPRRFGAMQSGQTVYGRLFTVYTSALFYSDEDYFLLTLSQRSNVALTVWSEKAVRFGIADSATCVDIQSYVTSNCPNGEVGVFSQYEAGTYAVHLAINNMNEGAVPFHYRVMCNVSPTPPSNNDCAAAEPIVLNSPTYTAGTTIGATLDCAANIYPEVWYSFNLDECSNVTVEYCGTPPFVPSVTRVYHESCCSTPIQRYELSWFDCEDGEPSMMFRGLEPGHYFLPICLTTPSDFTFRVTTVPYVQPTDHCEYAGSNWISSIPGYYDGRTTCATVDSLPSCAWPATAPGVWFGVTGNGRTLTATTCNTSYPADFDTRMTVFTCDCNGLVCIGENDDAGCPPNQLASSVTWCSRPFEEYLILVHGYQAQTGHFRLQVTDNGQACATPLACLDHEFTAPGQVSGSIIGRRNDCPIMPSEDVQARVVLPYAGWWNFSLCGSDSDAVLFVDTIRCGGAHVNFQSDSCDWPWQTCLQFPARDVFVTIESNGSGASYVLNVTPSGPADTVQNVRASDSLCNGILVTWSQSDDEYFYQIHRDGNYLATLWENETEFMDYSVGPGWHLYHLTSFNGCVLSYNSRADSGRRVEQVTATPIMLSPPFGAQILSGHLANYCCSIVPNATSYNFLWDDDPLFQSPIGYTGVSSCVSNSFYLPLGLWYWKVQGHSSCGAGPWSVAWMIQLVELEPPELVISVEGTMVRLTWTASEFPVEYLIESSTSAGGGYGLLGTTMDTTFSVSIVPEDRRFFRVIAATPVNAAGTEGSVFLQER